MAVILIEIGISIMIEISQIISENDRKIISQNDRKIPSFSDFSSIISFFIDFSDHFQQKFFFAIILRNDRNFRPKFQSNSPKFQSRLVKCVGFEKGKILFYSIFDVFRGVFEVYFFSELIRILSKRL